MKAEPTYVPYPVYPQVYPQWPLYPYVINYQPNPNIHYQLWNVNANAAAGNYLSTQWYTTNLN